MKKQSKYFNWVLQNKLCIGRIPEDLNHLSNLENNGVKSVLSLCWINNKDLKLKMINKFFCDELVLPDHKSERIPTLEEIEKALFKLENLVNNFPPVYIHCEMAIERSPIICIAYLKKFKKLNLHQATDYMMRVCPSTNPLQSQLEILKQI